MGRPAASQDSRAAGATRVQPGTVSQDLTIRHRPAPERGVRDVMIRILFVSANPVDTDPLQLGEEFREIQGKLRSSDSRAHFVLRSAWAARPDDLLQQMNEFRPHILHFSGHGSSAGEIVLQDNSGEMQTVSPAALEALFNNFREWLRIVVLRMLLKRPG